MLRRLLQLFFCIIVVGLFLYIYIDKQNDVTELRLAIPNLEKEVKRYHEENTRLQYEINLIENPIHLMELVRQPEFSYLKYPHLDQVIILPEGTIPEP
jgi:hypothetical protein